MPLLKVLFQHCSECWNLANCSHFVHFFFLAPTWAWFENVSVHFCVHFFVPALLAVLEQGSRTARECEKQGVSGRILFFYFGKELRAFLAEWAWTMPRSDHSREKGRKQGRKATSCDTKRRSSCRQKRRDVNKEAKKAIKLIKDEKVVEQVRKAAVGKKRVWIRTWQKRTRKQGRLHMEKNGREPDSED